MFYTSLFYPIGSIVDLYRVLDLGPGVYTPEMFGADMEFLGLGYTALHRVTTVCLTPSRSL